ncbi:MAG: hypothetical protein K2M83_10940 [Muribaculaceae bacterium]|nr:hypothetical protein [Muribaculaceae bacterium]
MCKLYQTDYLTISEYDLDTDTVRLKVSNGEVTKALFSDLLKYTPLTVASTSSYGLRNSST